MLATWDKKLADKGFVDVEQRLECKGREARYLAGSPSSGDLARRLFKEETADYYRLARQHYHYMARTSGTRRKRGHITVWRLHSEGLSATKIVRAIADTLGFGVKRVRSIIRAEEAKMHARRVREIEHG